MIARMKTDIDNQIRTFSVVIDNNTEEREDNGEEFKESNNEKSKDRLSIIRKKLEEKE